MSFSRFSIACAFLVWIWGCNGAANSANQEPEIRSQAATLLLEATATLRDQPGDASALKQIERAAEMVPDHANIQQVAAETLYRAGRVKESLPLFDRVVELVPEQASRNWQRGLALCTLEEWKEGAEQFKTHHEVNPDDVENSAWYFLCVAKLDGLEAARKTVIPSRGDGRQPMMSVLAMLKGELEPEKVMQAAIDNTIAGAERERAKFYADLYVGLYYDSLGDDAEAAKFLERSLTYDSAGYMVDTARVYLEHRFVKEPSQE